MRVESTTARILWLVIRGASLLAPADLRREWRMEWWAEARHALGRIRGAGAYGALARARLILRTGACLRDALGLRLAALGPLEIGGDLRLTARGLARSPGFSVPVITTLSLTIGACTALFAVTWAVIFRPLPLADPHELVVISGRARAGAGARAVDGPDVEVLRERASSLVEVAFVRTATDGSLTGIGPPTAVRVGRVTGNYFKALGVGAVLGSTFGPGDGRLTPGEAAREDDDLRPLPPTVLVLSHGFWQRHFGGDPGVLGRTVRIDGNPAVVVGVMPPELRVPMPAGSGVPERVDAWTPIRFELRLLQRTRRIEDQDSDNGGFVVARVGPGADPRSARLADDMAAVGAEIRSRSPDLERLGFRLVAEPLQEGGTRHARPVLLALLSAAGLALLIGCLNVGGLVVARSHRRSRERAVRAALGASRARLIREGLLQALVLGSVGSALGVGLAAVSLPGIEAALPPATRVGARAEMGLPVALFGFGIMALAAVASGLLPNLGRMGPRLTSALGSREGAWAGGGDRRALLVGGQLALVTILLVGSGRLLESVRSLLTMDPGFEPRGVLVVDLDLVFREGYRGPADRAEFLRTLETRLGRLPGVAAVGTTGGLPLSGVRFVQAVELPDDGSGPAERLPEVNLRVVTPGYFEAMGTRILAGRGFVPGDDGQDRRVAIVDRVLAERLSRRGGSAVGGTLRVPVDGEVVTAEVVGVVEPVRFESLREAGPPAVYVPYRHEASRNVSVLVRSDADPEDLVGRIRSSVQALDPRLPLHRLRPLEEIVEDAVAPSRFLLRAFTAFSLLTLLLACVGVFGTVSYEVSRRRRELGIRAAVGASRISLGRRAVSGIVALTLGSVALGVALALAGGRALDTVAPGSGTADPGLLSGVVAVVLTTALLSSAGPTLQAVRTSPMEVLREE